jgi:N-acetylmuramoyl-L-alanine amidase
VVNSRESDSEYKKTGGSNLAPPQYTTFLSNLQMPLRRIFGLKVKKILIDPGHGGDDLGAVGQLGTKEKDITLDIARKLRERLRKHPGYQILMTREDDITLPLEDRIEFANYCGADLFISIHINYIPNVPISIIETYYFGPHTDKAALLLAEKENKGTEYTLKDFKEIILNIENTLKTQESRALALYIQKSLYRNISRENKNIKSWGLKTAPFIVLLGVNIPSVLTEVTCLSNADEEKKLNQEHYREKIAGYLEEGIVSYLNKNIDKGGVMWSKKSL